MKRTAILAVTLVFSFVSLFSCAYETVGVQDRTDAVEVTRGNTDTEEDIFDRFIKAPEVPDDLLACTYTDEDQAELMNALALLEKLAINGNDENAVTAAMDYVDLLYDNCLGQQGIANILYFSSMSEKDKAVYTEMNDRQADAYAAILEAFKKIYSSDSPHKETVFADLTEEELDALMAADNVAVVEYSRRISDIQEEFYALDSEEHDWSDNVKAHYVSLVENGNALAREYGYSNYYDYMSEMGYFRDYSMDKESFRGYVSDYIIPLYNSVTERYRGLIEEAEPDSLYAYSVLALGSGSDITNGYMQGFTDTFDGSIKEKMSRMLDGRHILWGGESSYQAACTVELPYYDEAVCYFGPGYYSSLSTVAHEAGHFVSLYWYDSEDVSLDFLEVHSQATQMLLLDYLKGELDSMAYELYLYETLGNVLYSVIVSTIVDDFEECVYRSEKVIEAKDIDGLIKQVCQKYGDGIYESLDMDYYIKMVVIQAPAYYVSYATSGMCALGLYNIMSTEGAGKAYEVYRKLQEGPTEVTFIENIEYAGLPDPFEEEAFKRLAEGILDYEQREVA